MLWFFFFQAEDGIRDLVRSRGLGDVYKRQPEKVVHKWKIYQAICAARPRLGVSERSLSVLNALCLLYTSDAADERSSVDLGGRRIIKKKTNKV